MSEERKKRKEDEGRKTREGREGRGKERREGEEGAGRETARLLVCLFACLLVVWSGTDHFG